MLFIAALPGSGRAGAHSFGLVLGWALDDELAALEGSLRVHAAVHDDLEALLESVGHGALVVDGYGLRPVLLVLDVEPEVQAVLGHLDRPGLNHALQLEAFLLF